MSGTNVYINEQIAKELANAVIDKLIEDGKIPEHIYGKMTLEYVETVGALILETLQ